MTFPDRLLAGYRGFKDDDYPTERDRYLTLAEKGQSPETMVIACCDSRATPEKIFGAAPGDLFVVRNVANIVPPYRPDSEYHATSAALEFAVQSLKVKNIVVLGHGRCGGIQAALDPGSEPLSPGDFIGRWMDLLAPVAASVSQATSLTAAERQTALERINVRHSLTNLRTFPFIPEREASGELQLHGAWFDIALGELWLANSETGDFYRAD